MKPVWAGGLDAVAPRLSAVRAFLEEARARLGLPMLPWLLAPPVLGAEERARIARAAEAVCRALLVVGDLARRGEVSGMPLPDDARALAPPGDGDLAPLSICRLDALYDPASGDLAFLEVQAGDPSGPGWNDVLLDAWRAAGVLQALDVDARRSTDAHRGIALSRAACRGDAPTVVFACPDDSFVVSDHEAMAERYREAGVRAVRAPPRALRVEGGRVVCDELPVDLVVRDSHEDVRGDDRRALQEALAAGVAYVNPLHDARFDDKRCFALLRHPRVQALLDDEARSAVERFVPEVIVVNDAGRERLQSEQDGWVLKPATGYGGFGVVVGRASPRAEWTAALERSITEPAVAQRVVWREAAPWPVLEGDGLDVVPRFTTWSFWLHGGRMTEAFLRAGRAPVVNVHQGGGIGPVLFAGGHAS